MKHGSHSPNRSLWTPRHWLSWAGFGLLWLLSFLPARVLMAVGAGLGGLFFHLHRSRRHVVLRNIERCFPELGARAHTRMAQAHIVALFRAVSLAGVAWWGSRARLARIVRWRGREHYDAALASGRRVILLAPHFVGMTVSGVSLSAERPMAGMYKASKNPVADRVMYAGLTRYGAVMIQYNREMLPLIRRIREGRPFYYLPDQDAGRVGTVFVPFFGIPAATVTAVSRIAHMTGAVVIPCFARAPRDFSGIEIEFGAPLTDFPGDDLAADAARVNAVIEAGVRIAPEHYFWVHRRFKTRPEGEGAFYD